MEGVNVHTAPTHFYTYFTVIVAECPVRFAAGMNATYKDESAAADTFTAKNPLVRPRRAVANTPFF